MGIVPCDGYVAFPHGSSSPASTERQIRVASSLVKGNSPAGLGRHPKSRTYSSSHASSFMTCLGLKRSTSGVGATPEIPDVLLVTREFVHDLPRAEESVIRACAVAH